MIAVEPVARHALQLKLGRHLQNTRSPQLAACGQMIEQQGHLDHHDFVQSACSSSIGPAADNNPAPVSAMPRMN